MEQPAGSVKPPPFALRCGLRLIAPALYVGAGFAIAAAARHWMLPASINPLLGPFHLLIAALGYERISAEVASASSAWHFFYTLSGFTLAATVGVSSRSAGIIAISLVGLILVWTVSDLFAWAVS